MTDIYLPAWSEPFVGERRAELDRLLPIRGHRPGDRRSAGSTGAGVTVAIIDSGVERDHPAVGGRLVRSVRVELGDEEPVVVDDPEAIDVVGHGTACAGIIHGLAPGADLISVRVLGPDNRGKGTIFAAGLEWAIAQGATVINLSLSSKSEALFGAFHELVDQAYFANVLLVSAANNVPGAELPVAVRLGRLGRGPRRRRSWTWFYNPLPPVEFGAYGVDVDGRLEGRRPDGRDRQQLRGARTSPGSRRSSGRSTRGPPRSR